MAAPLNTSTTIEQHGVVRFLLAKGMAAKDIHKEMLPMYDEYCLSRQAVHNWVQKFSEGRTSIEDEHRSRSAGGDRYAGNVAARRRHHPSREQPQEFYAAGFQGFVKRWDKCLNLYGDYVET